MISGSGCRAILPAHAGDPPIIVRDDKIEHGFFELDPCNLHDGEAETVAACLIATLRQACAGRIARQPLPEITTAGIRDLIDWLP